eukprot:TRINITY_DN11108_c0_g1_i1.p1 TRINITY_DN11108_c0_g1~~TRINITY_DN11108_c0_g1_i1.p1  ORF type:complete len:438 (+),score=72.49 TRINITY_DN11108_c0_g1_i1:96-1409(+)
MNTDDATEPFILDPLYEFDAPKKYDFSRMSEGIGVDQWFDIKEAEMFAEAAAELELLLAEPPAEPQQSKPRFQRNPLLKTTNVPSNVAGPKRKRIEPASAALDVKKGAERSVRQKVANAKSVQDVIPAPEAEDQPEASNESSLPKPTKERPKLQFKLTVPQSPHLMSSTRRLFKRPPAESTEERQLREMRAMQQQIKMKLKNELKDKPTAVATTTAAPAAKSALRPAATAPTGFAFRTNNLRKRPLPEPSFVKDPLSMDSPPSKKPATQARKVVAAKRTDATAKPAGKSNADNANAARVAAERAAKRQADQERRAREAAARQALVAKQRQKALQRKAERRSDALHGRARRQPMAHLVHWPSGRWFVFALHDVERHVGICRVVVECVRACMWSAVKAREMCVQIPRLLAAFNQTSRPREHWHAKLCASGRVTHTGREL